MFSAAFAPVAGITVAHFGRWWDVLGRSKYPHCEEQPPLGQLVENFEQAVTETQFAYGVVPSPRVWFISHDREQVMQIQRDRFLCNWRKAPTQQIYPRYEAVSSMFFTQLSEYREFVRREVGAELSFTQFELTYINHIDGDFATVGRAGVFPDLSWRPQERLLPSPSNVEAHFSFDAPEKQTRLHANINTGRRNADRSPVLIVDLSARGVGSDPHAWFAFAHEWIVRGFADLTSDAAHRKWGRER